MAKFEQGLLILGDALGHGQVTVSTSAVALPALPTDTGRVRRILIRTLGQPINFRDDGTAPTSTTGFPLLSNDTIVYEGNGVAAFKLIRSSAATGDADVRVAYYGV